jgi:hypothetical protein
MMYAPLLVFSGNYIPVEHGSLIFISEAYFIIRKRYTFYLLIYIFP